MEANPIDGNSSVGTELFDLITNQIRPSITHIVEPKNLKYAMYVRKSTENEDRQVQSIPDQIKDCIELVVKPNGILFNPRTDVFQEHKSAKEAGTRPEFRRMMQMITDGKYDGIIAWHYDRLARNMKEAGEIIDLIDRNLIKDLKLAKATFENTPNGKMILGISFVLSKHYSDHLSESVLRGNNSSTLSGRILRAQVHGYTISDDRRLIADDANFLLIQHAFQMRLSGESQKSIANYLNASRYKSHRKNSGHTVRTFDVDMVSKLLKEPVYAGVYTYGSKVIKISDTDPDFTPMITEEEYFKINGNKIQLSYVFSKAKRVAPNNASDFLRGFIICSHCKQTMGTSITTKYIFRHQPGEVMQSYFRFRCDTKACLMHGSGPRGSIVLDYALAFLDAHIFTTKNNYAKYREDAEITLKLKTDQLNGLKKSLTSIVSKKRREYSDALVMAADKSNASSIYYTPEHLGGIKKELDESEAQLIQTRKDIAKNMGAIKTYEEYLKLFKNTADLLRSTSGLGLSDSIIRIFFSNLTVEGVPYGKTGKQKQWSVIDHCLHEPFDDFVKNGDFMSWSG